MGTDSDTRLDCGGHGHTPGPWHVVPYGDGDSLVVCSDEGGEWRICFMATHGGTTSVWEAIQANARLIAAAPELLTQLEYAVKLLGAFAALNGTAQVQSMRDTIAKARGQSPLPLDPSLSNKNVGA